MASYPAAMIKEDALWVYSKNTNDLSELYSSISR